MMPLLNGEVAVAHAYLSDSLQASKKTGGKIEYVIPEEGATFWIDNLVIPRGANHVAEAHALINYLLEPSSFQIMTQQILAAPANPGAIELLPKALQQSPVLFPSPEVLSKCEMLQDLGDAMKTWDRIWTEVKAEGS
jgi:spermidine/putrescine transport system substrate-binding protein